MDVRDSLIDSVRAVLTRLGVTPDPGVVQVERPSNPDHGDWSTNAALATARAAGRNPRELATALAEALASAQQDEAASDNPPQLRALQDEVDALVDSGVIVQGKAKTLDWRTHLNIDV